MISSKSWCGGTKEEYETQHFGFGVQRLQLAIRQMVEQKITSYVNDMNSYLQENLDLNETDKATLTRSCNKLCQLYCERAGPSLEIIDQEIEKMLSVPLNTLLPGDEVQSEQISAEDYEKLKEEVSALRQKVERGALMEALLIAEEEELVLAEKVCEKAKNDMDALDMLQKTLEQDDNVKSVLKQTQALCAEVPFINCELFRD